MRNHKTTRWAIGGLVLAAAAAAASLSYKEGDPRLLQLSDISQLVVISGITLACLYNATRSKGQARIFWAFFLLGSLSWTIVQTQWVRYEVFMGRDIPDPFWGDILLFLHIVPYMAALAFQPHMQADPRKTAQQRLDFALVFVWWIFIYCFALLPYQYVTPNKDQYDLGFNLIYTIEQAIFLIALWYLYRSAKGSWKKIYKFMFAAEGLYMCTSLLVNWTLALKKTDPWHYYSGSMYDVALSTAQYVWLVVIVRARDWDDGSLEPIKNSEEDNPALARVATLAVITVPVLALYILLWPSGPDRLDHFRLITSCVGLLMLMPLIFWKQRLLNRHALQSLGEARKSYEDLQRLQRQLVQTEKMASMGRLVAGAAHEINNPLAAIMGYADLMAEDQEIPGTQRGMADKIRAQARRTKNLVTNLLAFAKQAPMQRIPIDLNSIVEKAIELRELDYEQRSIHTIRQLHPQLPLISADPNHLLQVCFHLMNNAVDAMQEAHGEGTLVITTSVGDGTVVLRCSDNGPGVEDAERVFEPFYTTKEIGKGTGLGLSACYGIVRDHGGEIKCFNNSGGGATFEVSFPVAVAAETVE